MNKPIITDKGINVMKVAAVAAIALKIGSIVGEYIMGSLVYGCYVSDEIDVIKEHQKKGTKGK